MAKGSTSKGEVLVAGQVDDLGLEVHGQLDVRVGGDELEELAVRLGLDDDRQQAVLERVVAEDVGERGADHGAEAEVR